MTAAVAIGVDIGGTKIAAGLVDAGGLIGDMRVTSTNAADVAEAVLERAVELARSAIEGSESRPPSAIGIATGGWLDPSSGRVMAATGLLPGWAGTDLAAALAPLGLPVSALNDAHAMGIAEARLGAGRDRRVCLSVAVGTGMGGALTIDGRLYEGARGMAGALGHVPVRSDGPVCSCGRRGCIEAQASGPAIARAFAICLQQSPDLDGRYSGEDAPDLAVVVAALGSDDVRGRSCAMRVVRTAGTRLGRVLAGVANVVDPNVIVIGGGAAVALGDPFIAAVRLAVEAGALSPDGVPVAPAVLGPSAGVVGAGLAAIDVLAGVPVYDAA
jgi:glucokinase